MIWLKYFVQHVSYRLFRFCFTIFQHFWLAVTDTNECKPVELCNIFYRFKLSELIQSSPFDFVLTHDRYESVEILFDDHWSLYCLDRHHVYFVLLPNSTKTYNAKIAPFMFVQQHKNALKVARIDLHIFLRWIDTMPNPNGTVVFMSSTARAGSTLMAKLLQCSDKITVFGEPDVFTNLAIMELNCNADLSDSIRSRLVSAFIKYFCKHQKADETIVIKPRSFGIYLVTKINDSMPEVKHCYVFRQDVRKVMESFDKMLRHMNGHDVIWETERISPKICEWMFPGFSRLPTSLMHLKYQNNWEKNLLIYMTNYATYYKNKNLFSIPRILYEDLMTSPETCLKPVFNLCKIPLECIDEALKVLQTDSQAGTKLSKENLLKLDVGENLNDEKLAKYVKYLCKMLDVLMIGDVIIN